MKFWAISNTKFSNKMLSQKKIQNHQKMKWSQRILNLKIRNLKYFYWTRETKNTQCLLKKTVQTRKVYKIWKAQLKIIIHHINKMKVQLLSFLMKTSILFLKKKDSLANRTFYREALRLIRIKLNSSWKHQN